MRKILFAACLVGCMLVSISFGAITFIDAELANTTIDGATPVLGVNCSTDYSNVTDNIWGWRTNRTDVNGAGIWVTDGGAAAGVLDRETTVPLKIDITLPNAGVVYDLYAVIMNNNSGAGYWDVSARIGDTGDFTTYNKNSTTAVSQALASDFEGTVKVSAASDMTFKVLIGQYTTTTANETVSIYINGLDTWGQANLDQRTRFDGVGYDIAPPRAVSPYDGETDVAVDNVSLSWVGGQDPNAVGYYVYLGTASDALTCLNSSAILPMNTGTYSLGNINMDTTYYWKIEVSLEKGGVSYPAGDPNNIFGSVFSFMTIFSTPLITEDPSNQVVSAGGNAEFTVGVESLTTPTFKWYSSTDAQNDTPDDDALLSTDQTLSISGATLADEKYYYCVVSNDSGTDVASAVAGLGIAREVAHWSLDQANYVGGQYQDLSGEGHHADPNGTPTFVAGQIGEGVSILRANGSAVPTTGSWARAGTWNPSAFSGMLSVTFWLKWAGSNSGDVEQVFVSKRSGVHLGDGTQWQITRPNSTDRSVWFQSPNGVVSVAGVLKLNEWQQIAVTFDGTTGAVYSNGARVGSGAFQLGNDEAAIGSMINLGGSSFDNTPAYWMNGVLDDVKIYNYPLTELVVAQMYISDNPDGSVCVRSLKPDTTYDINGDCIVDLSDFAELATAWLDCGLVPECIQ